METPSYNLQLINDLDSSFKEEFARHAKLIELKKGEPAFMGDELLEYFYIVANGVIKSYQINLTNAKEQTIFFYQQGDMFDTIVLLDGEPHDVMYEVFEDSVLVQLPMEVVREWLITNRAFNKKFFPYLAKQMRDIEELATDLSLYDTMHRLIKLLLKSLDKNNPAKYQLIQSLSHTEIASLIGSVRQVVERHLKEFKKEGLIESDRKHLKVKEIERLLEKI
jgi:CRP-like cAMP-binding protein